MSVDGLRVGFELEFTGLDIEDHIDLLWDSFSPYGEVVEDGSLDYGFEYVSPIFNAKDFLTNSVSSKIDALFAKIKQLREIKICNDTGLHFHLDKDWLYASQLEQLYDLVYEPEFIKLVIFIGGRQLNQYCLPNKPSISDIWADYSHTCSRHTILNPCANGGKTVEFRNPLSTVSLRNFLAKSQFVIALFEYMKTNPIILSRENFVDFLSDKSNTYGELKTLLKFF